MIAPRRPRCLLLFGFPTHSDRQLRRFQRRLPAINTAIERASGLSEAQLASSLADLKSEVANGFGLDQVLPQCFALVYEAARRTLGLSAYPVQLIGAQALAQGSIAEMRTGEGKTLVAAFAAALWALEGKGVHVITTNDYLAARDAQTLAPVYQLLGLSVAVVYSGQPANDKVQAYAADITYGTSAEFGFDYLRHHMAQSTATQVRRPSHCALVDEVDSLLIDEARTPLIISGDAEHLPGTHAEFARLAQQLVRQDHEKAPGDYWVDEKDRRVHLSEEGLSRLEALAHQHGWVPESGSLYASEHLNVLHMADMALRAHALFHRDVHYVVSHDQVVLVDPFTGRTQPGRRWNHGLHQAVEAKEGLVPGPETRTMASIAVQHYFSTYHRVAGMTGTAATERKEFKEIYGLDIVEVPTHKPMIRQDFPDVICVSREDKYRRVIEEVAEHHRLGRPVLIGTPSVSVSDEVARRLAAAGLGFENLNARDHAREAQIIAGAGRLGAITLATSMAGRGTDIILGGQSPTAPEDPSDAQESEAHQVRWQAWKEEHSKVVSLGGLHVVGVERQESRRVDNQFRGRAGRQGDPGSSRFFLSLEDDLLRIFAQGWAKGLLSMLGVVEGQVIENARISSQVEKAQRQMEVHHFNARKNLLDYDHVVHAQRQHVYAERQAWLEGEHDPVDLAPQAFEATIASWGDDPTPAQVEQWIESNMLPLPPNWEQASPEQWVDWARQVFLMSWQHRAVQWADQWRPHLIKGAVGALDDAWRAHLERLDILRQGIHLRGYAQKQPLMEYRKDAHESFMIALSDARASAALRWLELPPSS